MLTTQRAADVRDTGGFSLYLELLRILVNATGAPLHCLTPIWLPGARVFFVVIFGDLWLFLVTLTLFRWLLTIFDGPGATFSGTDLGPMWDQFGTDWDRFGTRV